nr:protein defective in meristem silencing 3-like [Tanacetum cinerariifolium]
PGPRVGLSYAGQIDMTNFGRDELENGIFTRGESLITSFKNLENDMVLLGKQKNQPQEKYSKTYKNILDDVLVDIQGSLLKKSLAGSSSKQDEIRGGAPEISTREKLLTDKPAAFWNGPCSCCDSGLEG